MTDALDLAHDIADRDRSLEATLDTAPVERVRIDMQDGSRLELVNNFLGSRETMSVTVATMTERGWEVDNLDAAYIWRVHPAGSDERPGLMSARKEE